MSLSRRITGDAPERVRHRGPRRLSRGPAAERVVQICHKGPDPVEARRIIVDIPRFCLPSIPARSVFVADLDTTPRWTVPGAPCVPPRARPPLHFADPDLRAAILRRVRPYKPLGAFRDRLLTA